MTSQRANPRKDEMLAAALLPVLPLLLFLTKPFHIDDPVYIRVAQHVAVNPIDFFGFTMNWYGTEMGVHEFNQNPPGVSFYLAPFGALFGWKEVVLHAAMLIPTAAAGLGLYVLALRCTQRPLLAALTMVFTPGFLVSATNVMSDVLMLACYIWAVALWVHGLDHPNPKKRHAWLMLAAMCAAAAALTKYFGATTIPLLLAYTLAVERRITPRLAWLAIPIAILALYQTHTANLYGHGLFAAAAAYAGTHGIAGAQQSLIAITFVGLSFTGGCFFTILCFAPQTWPRPVIIGSILLVAVCAAVPLLSPGFIHPAAHGLTELSRLSIFLAGVFIAGGLHLFALLFRELRNRGDAISLLLVLWLAGTFLFAVYLNWTVNARALLPMAPPAALLVARRLDYTAQTFQTRNPLRPWPAALGAVIALWVALADYELAHASRTAAHHFTEKYASSGERVYFQGHWGFQYYMEQAGFTPVDFATTIVYEDDIMIIPANNTNIRYLDPAIAAPIDQATVNIHVGLTTLDLTKGAGFYAHGYGPLPFVIGPVPPQRFEDFRIVGGP